MSKSLKSLPSSRVLFAREVVRRFFAVARAFCELEVMRRTVCLSFIGGAVVLALSSCAHASEGASPEIPIVVTDDPEAEAAFRRARAAELDGKIDEASEGYASFLERFPSDPLIPLAQLNLARVLLAKGSVDAAVPLLEALVESIDEEVSERARLHLGLAKHMADQDEEAVELLRPLEGKLLDPTERSLHARTLAASCLATQNHVCAVKSLDGLVGEEAEDLPRGELVSEIQRIVGTSVTDDDLVALYEELPRRGVAWPLVAKRMLTRVFASGDVDAARRIAGDLRTENVELSGDLLAMAERAESIATPDPNAIGLLLPLSGRGQEAGQEALRGVMYATGRFEGTVHGPSSNLVIRDTGSDPERTVRAVDELVAVHRVMAIVGTIDGSAAAAAARRCEELRVPFISLSVTGNVHETSEWSFRMLPSALPEARELARAAHASAATRVAVLRPENAYAERVSSVFVEAARSLGMNVVREVTYAADTRDFRKIIKELELARPDVIFLPDRATKVSVLAPMLASAGLWAPRDPRTATHGTRLVLPSIAWDEQLLPNVGRYLEGALIALPFRADDAGTRFDASYRDRYGKPPSVFATSAHDAYLIVRDAIATGAKTRDAFHRHMQAASPSGMVGPSNGFSRARGPRSHASVAVVSGGLLRPAQIAR
jgi:branched-chain amino acid transport system substrate-binding protein